MERERIEGYIHSYESMGLVDGPGIRFVVFLQGCGLRCSFCHNPDTWNMKDGTKISAEELFSKILRYKPYFATSGGGVTFSGGEPLMQPEFLIEMLKLCKEEGIHTAIDTAGVGRGDVDKILSLTDLVMLDVKHLDEEKYRDITDHGLSVFNEFAEKLKKSSVDVWLRAVIIPTINNNLDYVGKVADYAETFPNIKKVELLPYHTLGVNKYKELGIQYRLKNVAPMDKRVTDMWQERINLRISKNKA